MPHDLTPATRAMRARLGALSRISAPDYDPHAATAPATAGIWAKLEAEVDPTGALPADAGIKYLDVGRWMFAPQHPCQLLRPVVARSTCAAVPTWRTPYLADGIAEGHSAQVLLLQSQGCAR